MAKPIAGRNKLPFGTTGMVVHGAKKIDGTIIKNLRILKQRSHSLFELLDTTSGEIVNNMKITSVSELGYDLDINMDDDEILDIIPNGTFFIKVIDSGNTIGFCKKLYNNLVHTSNGPIFISDYSNFYITELPQEQVIINDSPSSFVSPTNPNLLNIGSGNSSQSMIVSSDSILEMSIAARRWQPSGTGQFTPVVVPENNKYTIELDKSKNQDWTIPFSIGLVSNNYIGKLTDLYNISLTFYGNPQGLQTSDKITWVVTEEFGKLILKDSNTNRNIVDSVVPANLTSLINIQRYKFYKNELNIITEPDEIPTGTYTIVLSARNLITNELNELKMIVDVSYI